MRRVLSWLERIINGVSSLLLVLVTVVLAIQVFARYVLNSSTVWSEELARYSIVWLTLLTLGVVIRRAEDIRVDFIDHYLTTRLLRVGLAVFLKLLEISFMVVLVVSAVRLLPAAHSQMITGLQVPLSYVVWSFVIGPALTLPFLIERIFDIVTSDTKS
jgi:TRAP-type C4-dicarboxylate transport system permease small subunit